MTRALSCFSRRDATWLLLGSAASVLFTSRSVADAGALVPQGEDRFFQRTDQATNTQIVEGLDFTLDQSFIPGNLNLIVRGDNITLSGAVSLPGRNITIMARSLTCISGAKISTTGRIGDPSYSGVTAPPGSDGAKNTGAGFPGGKIAILVGEFSGDLQLDASGGHGGDAENGGIGANGSPGASANQQHGGGPGSPGHIGGLAGVPGAGGDGGDIFVSALNGMLAVQIKAASPGGAPGKPGINGPSGQGGPGGPGANGVNHHFHICGPV